MVSPLLAFAGSVVASKALDVSLDLVGAQFKKAMDQNVSQDNKDSIAKDAPELADGAGVNGTLDKK
jgi:hypothetical protein